MLKIFKDLGLFFEDNYRRISVREYASWRKVSPPTASTLLKSYSAEGLLNVEKDRNYLFFYARKENPHFISLSRMYWQQKLEPLVQYFEKNLVNPTIILFGSLSKAEATPASDIDLVIFAPKKDLRLESFEKKLQRKIEIFWFSSVSAIPSKELANNMLNGLILKGRLSL